MRISGTAGLVRGRLPHRLQVLWEGTQLSPGEHLWQEDPGPGDKVSITSNVHHRGVSLVIVHHS